VRNFDTKVQQAELPLSQPTDKRLFSAATFGSTEFDSSRPLRSHQHASVHATCRPLDFDDRSRAEGLWHAQLCRTKVALLYKKTIFETLIVWLIRPLGVERHEPEHWVSQNPARHKVGFMYMLQGGTDASNTDPYALKPTAENNWVKTGPHVMVVGAMSMMQGYPESPNPDTSKPYVMWAGTPYAHLMIRVR